MINHVNEDEDKDNGFVALASVEWITSMKNVTIYLVVSCTTDAQYKAIMRRKFVVSVLYLRFHGVNNPKGWRLRKYQYVIRQIFHCDSLDRDGHI